MLDPDYYIYTIVPPNYDITVDYVTFIFTVVVEYIELYIVKS